MKKILTITVEFGDFHTNITPVFHTQNGIEQLAAIEMVLFRLNKIKQEMLNGKPTNQN